MASKDDKSSQNREQETIVILDGDFSAVRETARILEDNGFIAIAAYSGEEALETLRKNRADLLLTEIDIGSGGMDGAVTARKILEEREIPLLFFTRRGDKETVGRVRGIAHYGYVLKSSGWSVLIESVRAALDLFGDRKTDRNSWMEDEGDGLVWSQEKYRFFFENVPISVHVTDRNFIVKEWNAAAAELFGYTKEEMIGADMFRTTYSASNDTSAELLKKKLSESLEENIKRININYNRSKDGRDILCEWIDLPYRRGGEDFIISVAKDITAENNLLAQLEKSLEEKDFLLREVHHRIKNNLAIITSLISLKAEGMEDEHVLSDIQSQVAAIQLIHEKLYQSDRITHIAFHSYVEELLETIYDSFFNGRITIENEIEETYLDAKTSVPLGLLINEAATNAMKHGFTPEGPNVFRIEMFFDTEKGTYRLAISNTGKAFPSDIELDNAATLGLRLISALVKQLEGTVELKKAPRTEYVIEFPV